MLEEKITEILQRLTAEAGFKYPAGIIISEPPADFPADLATNIALQVAKENKVNPRQVAETFKAGLEKCEEISGAEIAGPGFLNISLKDAVYRGLASGLNLPKFEDKGEKVLVEFVSANPTGPLHIGNSRGGPIGETICRVLTRIGY